MKLCALCSLCYGVWTVSGTYPCSDPRARKCTQSPQMVPSKAASIHRHIQRSRALTPLKSERKQATEVLGSDRYGRGESGGPPAVEPTGVNSASRGTHTAQQKARRGREPEGERARDGRVSGREGRLREKRGSKMRGVGVTRARRAGGLGDARRTIFPYSRLRLLIHNTIRIILFCIIFVTQHGRIWRVLCIIRIILYYILIRIMYCLSIPAARGGDCGDA